MFYGYTAGEEAHFTPGVKRQLLLKCERKHTSLGSLECLLVTRMI